MEIILNMRASEISKNNFGIQVLPKTFEDCEAFRRILRRELTTRCSRFRDDRQRRLNALRQYANSIPPTAEDRRWFSFDKIGFVKSGSVELRCQTFAPRVAISRSDSKWWEILEDFPVINANFEMGFLHKRLREDAAYSFKFYIRVPTERMHEYREAIFNANVVVTGKGEPDPNDSNWWRIWFLHDDGFIHPYYAQTWAANHSFMDLSLLR